MSLITVDAQGLDPVIRALGDRNALRDDVAQALEEGVSRFGEEAKAQAPRMTGTLAGAVYTTSAAVTGNGAEVSLGIDDRKAPHGKFVVGGTRAHTVTPVRAKALAFSGPGGAVFAKEAHIPARAPNDFITRAWDKEQADILQILEETLAKEIEERI